GFGFAPGWRDGREGRRLRGPWRAGVEQEDDGIFYQEGPMSDDNAFEEDVGNFRGGRGPAAKTALNRATPSAGTGAGQSTTVGRFLMAGSGQPRPATIPTGQCTGGGLEDRGEHEETADYE
ncbi:sodium channel protein type 10 subunit alpha, partial [Striga asiatica]